MRAARPVQLTLFVALGFSAGVLASEAEATEPTPWRELVDTVELIRSDAAAARLAAADWSCSSFEVLPRPPDGHAREAVELGRFLISFARTSGDDWLVDRLALALAGCAEPGWSPLFLDFLDHPSIQLRWRAARYYADVADPNATPKLEAFWNEDLPTWVRTDLADALLENGSIEHAEDCVDLVDGDDTRLARAALRTLKEIRPRGALEALRRHAKWDDSRLRKEAVEALAAWPDDTEIMHLLVHMSRSEDATIRNAASSALADFSQPEALDRLVEIASDPEAGHSQRLAALKSVTDSGLARLGIAPPVPESLLRDFTVNLTFSCFDALDSVRSILPPDDGHSVRCWAAPHIAGDPEDFERLEEGMPIDINDHFQSGDEHWVQVQGESCWIPIDQLDESIEPWEANPDRPFRHEFDVSLEEIDSPMGKALLAARMIRVFDITEAVAAIEFAIDPDDRDRVGLLAEIYVDDDSVMSYFVWDAMNELENRPRSR